MKVDTGNVSKHLKQRVAGMVILAAVNMSLYTAHAQEPVTLGLYEVYRLAEGHDAVIAAARAERDAGRESLDQGRAQLLPSLTLEGSYYDNNTRITTSDAYNSSGYGLSLSQPLYRRQNLAIYRQSKLQAANALDRFTLAQQQLMLRVSSAYFNVLIAKESLSAAQVKSRAMQRSLERAKRRFEVGRAIVTEIDEARARYDLARAELISATNDLNIQKESMYKIIGPVQRPFASTSQGVPAVVLSPVTLTAWEALAKDNSVSVRIARNNLELAKQELDRVRGEHFPTVDLIASYRNDGTTGVASGDSETMESRVGLKFQFPLYQGGAVSSRVREAVANRERSQQELRDAMEQSLLETRQAYLSVTSGRLRVEALEQALRSSKSSLAATRKGFEVGKRTLLDVLNAQQQLYETQRDLAGARYGYLNSIMQLKVAAGVITVDDIQQIDRLIGQ